MKGSWAKYLLGIAVVIVVSLSFIPANSALAADDATLNAIIQRLNQLEKIDTELKQENADLKASMSRVQAQAPTAAAAEGPLVLHPYPAAPAAAQAGQAAAVISPNPYQQIEVIPPPRPGLVFVDGPAFPKKNYERKPGDSLTFTIPGGEVTAYGNIDMSVDDVTKGLRGKTAGGAGPVGNMGWEPDLSTNLSYIGVRGFQSIKDTPYKLLYQLETQMDVAATSGVSENNSSESNNVKGALTSRNSFLGLSSDNWGAVKLGKTDAPYKTSTASMNPFAGMLGDYGVIMGNSGGDNRVEFGTRLDHSVWYESPTWKNLSFSALFSPGQNRASNSDNIASGESDCTGGNIPGSGGIIPPTCSDGSFSNAISAATTYKNEGFTIVAAYERHFKVNRSSDITGIYGALASQPLSQALQAQDVADEDAAKIAIQYVFPETKTTVSGIFERMDRYVASDLSFQNERQRNGTWFEAGQELTEATGLYFGWAHAFRTPGDPGQHNDAFVTPPGGVPGQDFTAGADSNNAADMLTLAIKHQVNKTLGLYADVAETINQSDAHYDLGAGGRAVTTDCHDAFAAAGGLVASNPHCWTGGHIMGVSTGMNVKF